MQSIELGRRGVVASIAAGVLLCLWTLPAPAAAAVYPAGGGAFAADAEGWQATEEVCNVTLLSTCEASGEHDPAAGNPPGALTAKTTVSLNLAGLFDSTVVFESPDFAVTEAGPATVHVERQFAPGGLPTLAPEATYAVSLIDRGTEVATEVVGEALDEGDTVFSGKDGAVAVVAGRTYAIAIEASTTSLAALAALSTAANVRFDNVALSVQEASSGEGDDGDDGGDGAAGPAGSAGGGGDPGAAGSVAATGTSAGLSPDELRTSVRRVDSASAALSGKRVFVKLRCPKRAGGACRITAQGRIRKRVRVTQRRTVKVAKGRARLVALRVKPRFRERLAKRKRLLVVQKVRVGEVTTTYARSRVLIRRR